MKFNYLKEAKENGHSTVAFKFARILKQQYGDRRYMAANWLSWAYHFQRKGQKKYAKDNLRYFLEEIAQICVK